MVLILELRDLLKIAFLLVQTLNQVQGDGGIEVPELAEGRVLWAGSTPDYFFATSLLIVLGFVLFATDSNFSGRREANKSMVLILELWKLFLDDFRPF